MAEFFPDLAQPHDRLLRPGLNDAIAGAHDREPGSPRWVQSIFSSFTHRVAPMALLRAQLGVFQQQARSSCTSLVQWLAVFLITKLRQPVFSIRGAVRRRSLVARADETRKRSSSDDIDDFHGNTSDSSGAIGDKGVIRDPIRPPVRARAQ